MKHRNQVMKYIVAPVALLTTAPAFAVIDTAATTAQLAEGTAAALVIGGITLIVAAAAGLFRWVRKAL